MTREQLERRCRELGYEPEKDDRDSDLLSIIEERERLRKAA